MNHVQASTNSPSEAALPLHTYNNETLIEYILTRYHAVHREQLPELIALAERVELVHNDHPLCPHGLSQHLQHMQAELEDHMQKEEQILFPMLANERYNMVHGPIHVMRADHDDHLAEIQKLYALTNNMHIHDDACNTWTSLYNGLHVLVEDLNQHIEIENTILFARPGN